MPLFKVALSYRVRFYREAEIEVEAEDEEEAEELARDEAYGGDIDWEDSGEEHDSIIVHPPLLIPGTENAYDACCAGTADCPCLRAAGTL